MTSSPCLLENMQGNPILRRTTGIEILQFAPDAGFVAFERDLNEGYRSNLVQVTVDLGKHE